LLGVQAGGIFVNEAAKEFLIAAFRRAGVSDDAKAAEEILDDFESKKMNFTDSSRNKIKLRVGMHTRMNVSKLTYGIDVKRGLLTLDG
jgi:hypothetical protein